MQIQYHCVRTYPGLRHAYRAPATLEQVLIRDTQPLQSPALFLPCSAQFIEDAKVLRLGGFADTQPRKICAALFAFYFQHVNIQKMNKVRLSHEGRLFPVGYRCDSKNYVHPAMGIMSSTAGQHTVTKWSCPRTWCKINGMSRATAARGQAAGMAAGLTSSVLPSVASVSRLM